MLHTFQSNSHSSTNYNDFIKAAELLSAFALYCSPLFWRTPARADSQSNGLVKTGLGAELSLAKEH